MNIFKLQLLDIYLFDTLPNEINENIITNAFEANTLLECHHYWL